MKPEQIKDFLEIKPFKPIRICMSDGASLTVLHPELMFVTRDLVVIASPLDKPTDLPEKIKFCAPEHIVRVEVLSKPSSKNGRREAR